MASLIVYGIMIAAFVAGVWGVIHSHDNRISAEEKAKWEPQVTACKANEKTAVDANAQLAKDFDLFKSHTADQRAGVDQIETRTNTAQETSRRLLREADARRAAAEKDLAKLKSNLSSARLDKSLSCEQKSAAVGAALDEAVRARLLYVFSIPDSAPAASDAVRVK